MPRSLSDQAIILRAWSVGETDRFCVLLTKEHGKIAVRVPGARKLLSKRGRGLLPLHVASVTWTEKENFRTIIDAACKEPHTNAWKDITSLMIAEKGVELVMHLTEDSTPVPEIYELLNEFLTECKHASEGVLTLFALKLLHHLGHVPSATHSTSTGKAFSADMSLLWSSKEEGYVEEEEDPYGIRIESEVRLVLQSLQDTSLSTVHTLDPKNQLILSRIATHYSPIQLGVTSPAGAPPACSLANSSAVTPI